MAKDCDKKQEKQNSVSISSTDAEIIAVSNLVNDNLLWIVDLIKDFDVVDSSPVPIFEDNEGAISISNDEKHTGIQKHKHIDTRLTYIIKECISNWKFVLKPIDRRDQLADIFTKALSRGKFEYFRSNL